MTCPECGNEMSQISYKGRGVWDCACGAMFDVDQTAAQNCDME